MRALYRLGFILAASLAGCGLEPELLTPDMEVSARRLSPLAQIRQDAAREFAERDSNRNGFISFGEFSRAVGFDNDMTPKNRYEVANFNIMRGSRLQDDKADLSEYTDVFVWNQLPSTQSPRVERTANWEYLQLDRNHDVILDAREMEVFYSQQTDPQLARQLAHDLDKKRNRADAKWDTNEFHNLKVWLDVLANR